MFHVLKILIDNETQQILELVHNKYDILLLFLIFKELLQIYGVKTPYTKGNHFSSNQVNANEILEYRFSLSG